MVLNSHTVKPLDEKTIIALAKEVGAVVTLEEHQVAGGLGSAVAEALIQRAPVKMKMIGVHDRFGQSGTPDELLAEYGLDVESIVRVVQSFV